MIIDLPSGFDRLIDLTSSAYDLTVGFEADADLDGHFEAICDDTGERLTISGWLFEVSYATANAAEDAYASEQRELLDAMLANPSPADISEVRADFANDATIDPDRIDDLIAATFRR